MASVEERVIEVTARVLELETSQIKLEHGFPQPTWEPRAFNRSSWWPCSRRNLESRWTRTEALSVTNVGDAVAYITKVCEQQGVDG